MNFSCRTISETEWDYFYGNYKGSKNFLQSWAYGQLRIQLGERVYFLGIFADQKLVGVCLIQKVVTRFKTYLHLPQGPLVNGFENDTTALGSAFWDWFLEQYKEMGKTYGCDFVRFSPLVSSDDAAFSAYLQRAKYRPAAIHLVNPEKTWVLDIRPDEEALLKGMTKSTRYEVKKGLKLETGLEVSIGNSSSDLDRFWALHEETVKRQKFVPFTKKSTELELTVFGDNVQIITVSHGDVDLSSSVIIFDDVSGYYHQGASIYSKLPASHASLWAGVMEAKKRGCKYFNFWGVSDMKNKDHPWYGLSKFKRGFGGVEHDYYHVHDFPITLKYWLNYLIERYRRFKRRY